MANDPAKHPPIGSFIPRRWLATFVDRGGGYHVSPDGTSTLFVLGSTSSEEEPSFAKQMLEQLSPKNRALVEEWLTSKRDFDPDAWLRNYERYGGWFMLDEQGELKTAIRVAHNDHYQLAIDMWRALTTEQRAALIEAREAQAAYFDPLQWLLEFKHHGGTVYRQDAHLWTGCAPEQTEAQHLRNRLIPSEQAKLRAYLYRAYEVPLPEVAA